MLNREELAFKPVGRELAIIFEPTVMSDVPTDAMVMNQEPFGPIAIINRFKTEDEAVKEANRLPYGLAAYAFTNSAEKFNVWGRILKVECWP